MKKPGDVSKGVAGVLLLAGLAVTLAGCSSPPKQIPFETISKHSYSGYKQREAKLVIVSEQKEMDSLSGLRPPYGLDLDQALSEIDFSVHFLLTAFQGYQASGGYEIDIVEIQQLGKKIKISAEFINPDSGATLGTTSPYHLVRVRKADLAETGKFAFILVDVSSGKEVAREEHTLQ